MNHMAQKSQLVQEFGTKKAQKKMNSVMTNIVKDDKGLQKTTYTGKETIKMQAQEVHEKQELAKKEIEISSKVKKDNFSYEKVFPA